MSKYSVQPTEVPAGVVRSPAQHEEVNTNEGLVEPPESPYDKLSSSWKIRNMVTVWSLSLLFLFSGLVASSTFIILAGSDEKFSEQFLNSSIADVFDDLGTVMTTAENQAVFVSHMTKSAGNNGSDSLDILRSLVTVAQTHPSHSENLGLASISVMYTIQKSGLVFGIEKPPADSGCGEKTLWCWGSNVSSKVYSTIIETGCTRDCHKSFPYMVAEACDTLADPQCPATPYVLDYRTESYYSLAHDNYKKSKQIISWSPSYEEEESSALTNLNIQYITASACFVNASGDCASLGFVDLTLRSVQAALSNISARQTPTGRPMQAMQPVIILYELRKGEGNPKLLATSRKKTTAGELQGFYPLVYKTASSAAKLLEDDSYPAKTLVSKIGPKVKFWSIKAKKYRRPTFSGFSWVVVTMADHELTRGTTNAVKQGFLLVFSLSIVSILPFVKYFVDTYIVHQNERGDTGDGTKGGVVKRFFVFVERILKPLFHHTPQTLTCLVPCGILIHLEGFYSRPNENYDGGIIALRIVMLGLSKLPLLYWLALSWQKIVGGPRDPRRVKYRLCMACFLVWLCTRVVSASLETNGRLCVFGWESNEKAWRYIFNYAGYVSVVGIIYLFGVQSTAESSFNMHFVSKKLWLTPHQRGKAVLALLIVLCGCFEIASNQVATSGNIGYMFTIPILFFLLLSIPASFLDERTQHEDHPRLREYKLIMVVVLLIIMDWVAVFFSNILAQMHIRSDMYESILLNDVPTVACSQLKMVCQHEFITSDGLTMLCWITLSGAIGFLVAKLTIPGLGLKQSIAINFGMTILRKIFSGFMFLQFRPFSPEFMVATLLEISMSAVYAMGIHAQFVAYFINWCCCFRSKASSAKRVKSPEALAYQCVTGIYFLQAYTISRMVMCLVLSYSYLGWSESKTFLNDYSMKSGLEYIASFAIQISLNSLALGVVRSFYDTLFRAARSGESFTMFEIKRTMSSQKLYALATAKRFGRWWRRVARKNQKVSLQKSAPIDEDCSTNEASSKPKIALGKRRSVITHETFPEDNSKIASQSGSENYTLDYHLLEIEKQVGYLLHAMAIWAVMTSFMAYAGEYKGTEGQRLWFYELGPVEDQYCLCDSSAKN